MTISKTFIVLAFLVLMVGLMAQKSGDPPKPGDAGRSPEGLEFKLPDLKAISIAQTLPLRVESLEVHELGNGTAAGKEGDLLLTFNGQGFLSTALSPRIELADGKIVLDDTLVSLDGARLFVMVSQELISQIEQLEFDAITIRNPGGLENTDFSKFILQVRPDELLQLEPGGAQAKMVYRKGEFFREFVER